MSAADQGEVREPGAAATVLLEAGDDVVPRAPVQVNFQLDVLQLWLLGQEPQEVLPVDAVG